MAARLAVDPDADLDLVVGEVEARPPDVRDRARGERDAHRADVRDDLVRDGFDGREVVPAGGGGPGDLLDGDGPGDPAPPGRVEESSTATSSFTSTEATVVPSASASSTAVSKLRTSPV
ncbi:hypothetical protein GCM10025865_32640 [Paraoerskovia sediminicola]|uniref:Uncharacterized protein n=1 Tax=Paraoerskovia sediminicola TaxID=1138587 RepID=A0ABM8G723_9CELL|nr:hypothetical protein GCM10025865_32640 [Paraoerskovia sediminicola]